MRKNPTVAEALLWSRLRRKQLNGLTFRRQHVLGPYVVDFYCRARELVIELDGNWHFTSCARHLDQERTEYLREDYGVQILRFTNEEVCYDIEAVICEIQANLVDVVSTR